MDSSNQKQKSVFLVSYFFPPINEIASERAFRLARSFCEAGCKVTVFAASLDSLRLKSIQKGNKLEGDWVENLVVKHVKLRFPFLSWMSQSQNKLVSFFQRALCKILRVWLLGDSIAFTWSGSLKKCLKQSIKDGKPDVLLCTVGPYFHMASVANICLKNHIPYIIDYRDLWTENQFESRRFLASYITKKIESKVVNAAKAVFVVAPSNAVWFANKYPAVKNVHVFYNLIDENILQHYLSQPAPSKLVLDKSNLYLFYAGSIYNRSSNGASFDVILKALQSLPQAEKNKIKVVYYGGKEVVKSLFESYGCLENLMPLGRVEKRICVQDMYRSDVLVSLVNNVVTETPLSVRGVMPGKTYELMTTRKPILNVSSVDADVNEFMENIPYEAFYTYTAKQDGQLASQLQELLRLKQSDKLPRHDGPLPTWSQQFLTMKKVVFDS